MPLARTCRMLSMSLLAALFVSTVSAHAQRSEDLVFDGLHGTLLTAAQPGPHLVVIVSGSGTGNRDGNHASGGSAPGMQTDTYRMLAEALAAEGYSSFRYDKRGVGASRGLVADRAAATKLVIGDFADDLAKVVSGLKARSSGQSIVIAGHSEGAMLAMMAAPRLRVAGLALLSGAGLPFIDVLERQLTRRPLPGDLQASALAIVAAYRSKVPVTDWPSELAALFNPINDAFVRSVALVDPRDLLQPVRVPVLIVGGAKDIQIERADFDRLASARPAGSQVLWVADMAHSLKATLPTDTSPLDAYARERPLSAPLLSGLADWLKALPPQP